MAVNRRLIVTSNGYQMATRRSRLKAWPEWAGAEYETALAAARLLNACLSAGQTLELLLLAGPPPKGVSVSDPELTE